jgi:hypothetical protein
MRLLYVQRHGMEVAASPARARALGEAGRRFVEAEWSTALNRYERLPASAVYDKRLAATRLM